MAATRSSRGAVLALVLSLGGAAMLVAGQQTPSGGSNQVFRAGVDVVAVEVQVVDGDGRPIEGLQPDAFQVSIGGGRRRVVSAEYVRYAGVAPAGTDRPEPGRQSASPGPEPGRGRTFILAIDAASFEAGEAQAVEEAAQRFVRQLGPDDLLGLYVYPIGPRISATRERAGVQIQLRNLIGQKSNPRSQFNLSPTEIVDITAGGAVFMGRGMAGTNPLLTVQARECPDEPACLSRIYSEASALALHYEGQAQISVGGLETLLSALSTQPGRKFVVLLSAGLLSSDRPGGRPDLGDMGQALGQTAAMANAVVYTIHADPSFREVYSAGRRRANTAERERDRQMLGEWLDQFSSASGGSSTHVPVGTGDYAFNRVLSETSSYYILGVEPEASDRGNAPRELRVSLNRRGASIRSRQWVVVGK